MNRLRTKKKGKDGGLQHSEDSSKGAAIKHSKTFRFGRKTSQETDPKEEEELDLENALPKSDDFRTSLLMSGLSARFSMLREQDDPSSIIGKASDDSVLSPTKQSRLQAFNYSTNVLCDIAEVSSICSSKRPPLPLPLDRATSAYSLDSPAPEDDPGSIMSRAKPVDIGGNNLFGGRQKIYKLPKAPSSKDFSTEDEMNGRVLYDDDVTLSAFQRQREKERQEQRQQQKLSERQEEFRPSVERRSSSPDLSAYHRRCETNSTTDSEVAQPRNSTAATSVTSHHQASLVKNNGTAAVPPGAGTATTAKLERSGTKSRRLYEAGLDQHIHNQQFSTMSRLDSFSRQKTVDTASATPSPITTRAPIWDRPKTLDEEPGSVEMPDGPSRSGYFEFDSKRPEKKTNAASDHGDPPISPPISDGDDMATLPIDPNDRGKATAGGVFSRPVQPFCDDEYVQRQMRMRHADDIPLAVIDTASKRQQDVPGVVLSHRKKDSNGTRADPWKPASSEDAVQPYDGHAIRSDIDGLKLEQTPPPQMRKLPHHVSESHSSSVISLPLQTVSNNIPLKILNHEKPPDNEHPANRRMEEGMNQRSGDEDQERPGSNTSKTSTQASGPSPGFVADLSGMVRKHLRSDSNGSSIYTAPLSNPLSAPHQRPHDTSSDQSTIGIAVYPDSFGHNPQAHDSPLAQNDTPAHDIDQFPVKGDLSTAPTQGYSHRRDASSATQKEREEFQHALAARRRRVQENLRSYIDSDIAPNTLNVYGQRDASATRFPTQPVRLRPAPPIQPASGGTIQVMKALGPDTYKNRPEQHRAGPQRGPKHHGSQPVRGILRPLEPAENNAGLRHANHDSRGRPENAASNSKGPRPVDTFERERQFGHDDPRDERSRGRHDHHGRDRIFDNSQKQPEFRSPNRQGYRSESQQGHYGGTRGNHYAVNYPDSGYKSFEKSSPGPIIHNTRSRSRSNSGFSGSESRNRGVKHRFDPAPGMPVGMVSTAHATIQEVSSETPQSDTIPASAARGSRHEVTRSPHSSDSSFGGVGLGVQDVSSLASHARFPEPTAPSRSPARPAITIPVTDPVTVGLSTPVRSSEDSIILSSGPSRKRVVDKSQISEPTFVSSTARMTTVKLSDASPLQGLNIAVPPLPTMHPRRKQTRLQTMFGPGGRTEEGVAALENQSTDSLSPRVGKLRKYTSEGDNLRARSKAAYVATTSPPMPQPASTTPHIPYNGGMF